MKVTENLGKKFYYNLQNYRLVSNRKIGGQWTLIRLLGKGGNGEVWQCRNAKGEEFAIKFLKSAAKEPYSRFYDEVLFMESFGEISGVLPIIVKHIPPFKERYKDKKTPFYYVMPLAQPIGKVIVNETVEKKISIVKSLLEMLVRLHKQGIAHRDIKPANILLYQGQYVLSDFGLVFFNGKSSKTPPKISMGAKWTRSPQMERDSLLADKFKSDVYAMAKTIWMIFSGDFTSFEGQYDPSSPVLSLNKFLQGKYLTPLDALLSRCTEHEEEKRPTAKELCDLFNDWDAINHDWDRENLLQWVEVQQKVFPLFEPDHCEWTDRERIIGILNVLCSYNNLNHLFFPDAGGLDLDGATISKEEGCIELKFGGMGYVVYPKRLCFERISDDYQWNYFRLEAKALVSKSGKASSCYMEEYGEVTEQNGIWRYVPLSDYDNMTREEVELLKARHIVRVLRGSMVIFHKDSFYNIFVSKYQAEHEKMGAEVFRDNIRKLSQKFKGKTMAGIRKQRN